MLELQKHYAVQKDSCKNHTLYDSNYVKCSKKENLQRWKQIPGCLGLGWAPLACTWTWESLR